MKRSNVTAILLIVVSVTVVAVTAAVAIGMGLAQRNAERHDGPPDTRVSPDGTLPGGTTTPNLTIRTGEAS
jgi:hypothetical protein